MTLKLSDYPRKQYGGAYFEFVDERGLIEIALTEAAKAMDPAKPDTMEKAAALSRRLADIPAGHLTARVYGLDGPLVFSGTQDECEAFILARMVELKVEA